MTLRFCCLLEMVDVAKSSNVRSRCKNEIDVVLNKRNQLIRGIAQSLLFT
jgi:hypothetical protein